VANFYTPTSGGLRTCLEELGRGYLAAGHERVLIVPGAADLVEQTSSGLRVTVHTPRLPGFADYRVFTSRRRVLDLLAQYPPDILEVSDKFSLGWLSRWSRERGVPLVLFSHERLDAALRPRLPRWFPLRTAADLVNRRLSRFAGQVIVTSAFSAAEFERIGAGNVARVPLGVDLETFRPLRPPAPPPIPPPAAPSTVPLRPGGPPQPATATRPAAPPRAGHDGVVHLVMVSRLSREKRPERAIKALRVLAESGVPAELVILGDGPLRRRLERQAAGLPVSFLGHLADRRVVAELVAAADIALSPSPAETFGLATLEALACGTPVVVPARGAARELVAGTGGGAIIDGTPRGIAQGVRELLAVPVEQRRAAARAAAERFPWSATVARLLRRYAAVVPSQVSLPQ
jgi:alpha-1,6-mannosyltransferase